MELKCFSISVSRFNSFFHLLQVAGMVSAMYPPEFRSRGILEHATRASAGQNNTVQKRCYDEEESGNQRVDGGNASVE